MLFIIYLLNNLTVCKKLHILAIAQTYYVN